MAEVGTRRSGKPAAASFVIQEFAPRQSVDVVARLMLAQDVTLALPPYGHDAAVSTPAAAAVPARFSGFRLGTTRTDGFWLVESFMFQAFYYSMYPDPWVGVANVQATMPWWACSADEGWDLNAIEGGIQAEVVDYSTLGGVMLSGRFAYVSANNSLAARIGGPIWCPPGSYIHMACDTVNTSSNGMFRVRYGGREAMT